MEGSDLVVTRMAMRNNQSKYLINGQSSNYAEVTNLLRGRGIDLDHNRFLILQGEVESIAQMKSKAPSPHEDGLLEYLEDIIGTVKYKAPIEESLVDMDKLSDERSERLGRLRIVEKEKDRLEGHKDEAEAYLKDCNNVARKKNILYQRYLLDLSENIQVCHQHIAELGQQLTDEEGKVSGRKDALSAFEVEYKRIEKEAKGMENEMKRVSKSHEDKNKENVKLDVKIKDLNSKIKKLKKTLTDDTHAFRTAQYNITELTEEMEKARKEAEEHEAGLGTEEEKLESIIDSLKGEILSCKCLIINKAKVKHKCSQTKSNTSRRNSNRGRQNCPTCKRRLMLRHLNEIFSPRRLNLPRRLPWKLTSNLQL